MTSNLTIALQTAVQQKAPVHGVSIGNVDDKSTWRVDFKSTATPAQVADVQLVIDNIDLLDWVKAAAAETLNKWRGNQRVTLGLTRADFQELVYTGKVLEVQRWLLDTSTPFRMANEAAQRGITNQQMADWVIAQWDAWQSGSDQIEATYVDLQQQVEAATTIEAVEAILSTLE